jgi:hypothetical protein
VSFLGVTALMLCFRADFSRAVKNGIENWASAPGKAYRARNTLSGENYGPKEAQGLKSVCENQDLRI